MKILGHIGCVGGDALTMLGWGGKGLWISHYFSTIIFLITQ
jgi:hypothetical protein